MKFSLSENTLSINGEKVVENLRGNIDGGRARIKATLLYGLPDPKEVDIFVKKISKPKLHNMGAEVELSGVELGSNTQFKVVAGYSIVTRKVTMSITYGTVYQQITGGDLEAIKQFLNVMANNL